MRAAFPRLGYRYCKSLARAAILTFVLTAVYLHAQRADSQYQFEFYLKLVAVSTLRSATYMNRVVFVQCSIALYAFGTAVFR